MHVPRTIRAAALLAALLLPACSDDPVSPYVGGDVVGHWNLVALAGRALPVSERIIDPDLGSCIYTFSEMEWEFLPDGTYSGTSVSSTACGGEPADPDTLVFAGGWQTEGNELITTDDSIEGEEFTALYTVEEDTFVLQQGSLVYVFERFEE